MKPLLGFLFLTLAVAAGVTAWLRPAASDDLEQHRSDAAGAVAYASLIKGADAKPAPAPQPTPPPQPIRAEVPEAPTEPAPKAATQSSRPPPPAPVYYRRFGR